MTLSDLVEEKFRELEALVIEYLQAARQSGEDLEAIRLKAYAVLEESQTVSDVREAFSEMIAIVEGITA